MVIANDVLRQVGATYGYSIIELPKLVMVPRAAGNRRIANLELLLRQPRAAASGLNRSRLLIDEELFDLCADTDKRGAHPGTALAFVIAHEMAHFYLEHTTYPNFADRRAQALSKQKSDRQELEADQKGLLFAYLAGYDPEPILAALFDRIYSQYKLTDPLPGHPTKAKRLQQMTLRAGEFRQYGYLFAVGTALYCREDFAEAARCFEAVFTRYPLREAYLNFGVCRLQETLRLNKKASISYFALPFEVDPRNRLLQLNERGTAPAQAATHLLEEAKAAFERAITMSPVYPAAYLNLAIHGLLANDPFGTLSVLANWQQRSRKDLPPNAELTRSLAYYLLHDATRASQVMKTAVMRKAYQASYNQFVLKRLQSVSGLSYSFPQQLRPQRVAAALPGCNPDQRWLEEIPRVPETTLWTDPPLINQNNPPPYLFVQLGQSAGVGYLRVDLRDSGLWFRVKR